jgi:CRISPR-associated protein Csm2
MSVQTIMTADESGAELVNFAKATAQRLVKDRLTRSQIRNIFTEVRQIEAMWPGQEAMRRLNMLKPKLSYSTARSPQVDYLEKVLREAIDMVDQAPEGQRDQRFKRFMDLFEAILAYHRAEGGRN